MPYNREGAESPFPQGVNEEIAYVFDFESWGGSPTLTSAKIYRQKPDGEEEDTTSTNLSGSTSVSGDLVTTPIVKTLLENTSYRLTVEATIDGNVMEAYISLLGEL